MNEDPRSDGSVEDVPSPGDTEGEEAPSPEISFPSVEEMDALLADYEVREVLGQGGMGAVYLGWQPRLERFVAIKVLRKDFGEIEDFAAQFRSEARTMANLHHSHIAAVHDFGETEGFHFLIMERVDGTTLYDHYYAGNFTPAEIIAVILQVCDALDYAHGHGVIHRDIKSANILVGQDGMSKVVDFGLATFQPTAPGVLRRRKVTGPNYGTHGFSAPEMFRQGAHVDHRADIYSLAVVLYEGLTGKTMVDDWTPPSQFAGVPAGVDQIIQKATRQDPRERYPSIDAFATALRQVEQGPPSVRAATSSKAATATARAARQAAALRHHPTGVKPAAGPPVVPILLIAVGLVVVAYLIFRGGSESAPKDGEVAPKEEATSGVPSSDPATGTEKNDPDALEAAALPEVAPIPEMTPEPDPVPEPDPDPAPEDETPPAEVVALEETLAAEMAELDTLFNSARETLVSKYAEALERRLSGADAEAKAALAAEITLAKSGPPPEKNEVGLHPVIVELRPALRTEYAKLTAPDAAARIDVLTRHIEKLRSQQSTIFGDENPRLDRAIKDTIAEHEERISDLHVLAAPPIETKPSDITVANRQVKLSANGTEILAPRGTGLGIFGGLIGTSRTGDDRLAVPPAESDGNWDLVRNASDASLETYGIYYQTPLLDFSKARFEVLDWGGGDQERRLISGDRGFPMISGVMSRIGAGTDFTLRYDPNNHFWFCSGPVSSRSTRILITNVDIGNAMLSVRTAEFSWKLGDPDVKMIHRNEGLCVLTALHGPFEGGGEKIHLRIDEEDGYWYLSGSSVTAGVAATATAFIFPNK